MNRIETIKIKGFWGDQEISLTLHPDVNFLIGMNGSGKTTLINLVAAALTADFLTLDRMPFSEMEIRLAEVQGRKKPSITVKKADQEGLLSSPAIKFSIKDSASGEAKEYPMDGPELSWNLRYSPLRNLKFSTRSNIQSSLVEHLSQLVNVSWLSIHRTTLKSEPGEDSSYESTVDKKLDDISNRLNRYFSDLSLQGSALLERFQREIYLTLLVREKIDGNLQDTAGLDPHKEQQALVEIFRQFSLNESAYGQHVNLHFKLFKDTQDKLEKREELSLIEVAALFATSRIHTVVQAWHDLERRREEIVEPRTTFFEILNEMLQGKSLEITDKSELIARSDSKKPVHTKDLSSGEKQLLIILGEALLQQKEPQIYIADEPELSLHVHWQERVVDNLRVINPNAQVLVATHSPDIVSSYGSNVFDMRSLFC